MSEIRDLATGLRFPEGPVAMPDGSVVLTEIAGGTITRVGADGSAEVVAETGGGPNGAALGPDGKLYVANNGSSFAYTDFNGILLPSQPNPGYIGHGWIERVDLATGDIERLYDECGGRPLRSPNDLVFDAHGGFYFTDYGYRDADSADRGRIYYAHADGSGIREVVGHLDAPNGIGLSPAGDTLYAVETLGASLWSWKVDGPGEIEHAPGLLPHGGTFLARPAGFTGFDSLAVDGEGNISVAHLVAGGITTFSPAGEVVDFFPCGDLLPTNICFGGDDLQTAYITLSGTGRLGVADWPRPGLALAH